MTISKRGIMKKLIACICIGALIFTLSSCNGQLVIGPVPLDEQSYNNNATEISVIPSSWSDTPSSWAEEDVQRAITRGLVPYNLQSQYTRPITRLEFTALAVSLYETVTGREIAGRMEWSDTYDINAQKMGYLGIVEGMGGGNFNPNDTITREQAAVMLHRLTMAINRHFIMSFGIREPREEFYDNAQISSWAADAIASVEAWGIMRGTGNNMFSPQGSFTREQSIITMLRIYAATNRNNPIHPQPEIGLNFETVIPLLEASGFEFEAVPHGINLQMPPFGYNWNINIGDEIISIYEFESNEEMERNARFIGRSGFSMDWPDPENEELRMAVQISWISYPHWFKKDYIIALYVGENEYMLNFLREVFGDNFAGQGAW